MTKYDMNQIKGIYANHECIFGYLLYDTMLDIVPHITNTKYLLIVDDIIKIIKVYDTNSYPIIHKYPIERCSDEDY